ncbi:MAG TPA: HAD family hydrolase [Longimicrobiales bacterium]|nr:HAD family hydrolase [Longimicrobiales bacterium]
MKRLLLFDIDGTLVLGGPAKGAFHAALLETFGTAGPIDSHNFAGKTDPQIARELLSATGMAHEDIEAGFPRLWDRYLRHLGERLNRKPMNVLPGVGELLEALSGNADVALGLLTGNIVRGAELKLRSAGLFDHFRMGSYGSDSEIRNHLAPIALQRAAETWSVNFDPRDVWVVGDTPADIECGQAGGTRTLGVATGRYSAEVLAAVGADEVLHDLSDTAGTVAILTA